MTPPGQDGLPTTSGSGSFRTSPKVHMSMGRGILIFIDLPRTFRYLDGSFESFKTSWSFNYWTGVLISIQLLVVISAIWTGVLYGRIPVKFPPIITDRPVRYPQDPRQCRGPDMRSYSEDGKDSGPNRIIGRIL